MIIVKLVSIHFFKTVVVNKVNYFIVDNSYNYYFQSSKTEILV